MYSYFRVLFPRAYNPFSTAPKPAAAKPKPVMQPKVIKQEPQEFSVKPVKKLKTLPRPNIPNFTEDIENNDIDEVDGMDVTPVSTADIKGN